MTVHLGLFGSERSRTFECYLDEQLQEDCFAVCLRPMDYHWVDIMMEWCEDNIGEQDTEWGYYLDEHYSMLSYGNVFWFKTDGDRMLFRMAWSPF